MNPNDDSRPRSLAPPESAKCAGNPDNDSVVPAVDPAPATLPSTSCGQGARMVSKQNGAGAPRGRFGPGQAAGERAMDVSDPADRTSLGLELAREMRRRWRCGERPTAEEFLKQHAELRNTPEAAIDVIYEEYCLREAAGEERIDQDVLRRFPQWRAPLQVMLDCHRVLRPSDIASDFPSVGDTVGGFRLVDELGRGARGRVCLARQTDLGGRPVVLKITSLDGVEHLSLARLQHTNIVPVYSVADDTDRSIRILCMPYFGRATLASLLQSLASVPLTARTGLHVLSAIDERREPSHQAGPAAAPAREALAQLSYVQATCWITACLADALHYAHERGLVHLDVKPSNVLLATDGQPMLLDFHLAREPIQRGAELPDKFGGTPAYMPPEQRAAMHALEQGRAIEDAVDARADIYALGAILYELLGGTLPIAAERQSLQLSKINPYVSTGLVDIVAKCLAPRPDERYASARALADDLRRHMADQPLTNAPNRSLAERWRKWRRRKPHTLHAAGMLAVVVAAAGLALAGRWSQMLERCQQAERTLREGQAQLERGLPAEATATFERGLTLVENLAIRRDLAAQLRDQVVTARRLRASRQLHQLADQIRVVFGADPLPPARLRPLAELCREFWENRQQIAASLDANRYTDVATDLLDTAIFWADLQVRLVSASDGGAPFAASRRMCLQQAIRTLDEAEAMFGPSPVLDYQRHVYREALAKTSESDTTAARSATVGDQLPDHAETDDGWTLESGKVPSVARASPTGKRSQRHETAPAAASARRSAWEHYALGRALLNSNQLAQAAEQLGAACAIDPSGPWPNFYYGVCAYRMGRYDDAIDAFSVCIGAAPTIAGCFHNRALAYDALGRADRALHDYDRALELDPTLAAAWLNRGMLKYRLQYYPEATADLRTALEHGADAATVHYDLALVHMATNDTAGALADIARALENKPDHQPARQLGEALRQPAPGRPRE